MSAVTLLLFGPPQVQVDGQAIYLRKRKAEALLAYLAITRTVHSRDTLATLLWPEFNQRSARMYLRQHLYYLRRSLGTEHFAVTTETLALAPSDTLTTDVEQFRTHLTNARQYHTTNNNSAMLTTLAEAISLYRADFLSGFAVGNAPNFEEWQGYERESLRHECVYALQELAAGYRDLGKLEQALAYARRWVVLEPLQEMAHRCLMQLYAQADDQAAALQQYEACATLLAEELDALPAAETTALYAQIKTGKLTLPSQQRARMKLIEEALPTELPHQPTPFIGRTAELAQIARDLADPACRLLTVLGPGGIGKSRLAIEAARNAAKEFAQGIYFVPLAALDNPKQIESAILQALDIPQQSALVPRAQLLDACRNKQMLLVLDNYEQLLPDCEAIVTLLDYAPQIKLLVTTRERLNLAAEWTLPLAGLDLPPPKADLPLLAHSAVQLFVQAAQRVQPAFVLAETNSGAVVQLCRLVDGNPLALELAAGWLKMMPPALIVHEIQRDLGVLRTETADVPLRHRSMAIAFEHSWRLLTNGERNIMRQLAIFVDTFDYTAAHAVTGATLPQLAMLVDKSWISATTAGRLYLHKLVHQFAMGKLAGEHQPATGEAERVVRRRYGQWYGQLLQQLEPLIKGQDQITALERLRAERANIFAAWHWAVTQHATTFLRQVNFVFWYAADTLGWLPEAIDAYDAAINGLRAEIGLHTDILYADIVEQEAHDPVTVDQIRTLADLLTYQAILYPRYGRLAQAQQNCTEALAYLQALPDTPDHELGQALATLALGWIRHDLAEDESARILLSGAHAIFKKQQNSWWLGQAELILGLTTLSLGHYNEAKQHFVAAAQLWQTLGEQRFRCFALGRLAELAGAAGDYTGAQSYLTEVYQLRHQLGDRVGLSYALIFLGDTALAQGDQTGAERWYIEAKELAHKLGNAHVFLDAQLGLGQLALIRNAWTEADHAFQAAYHLALEAQRPQQMVSALLGRSNAALAQKQIEQAHIFLQEALQLASQTRADPLLVQVLFHVAEVAYQQGDAQKATSLLMLVSQHPATSSKLQKQATALLTEITATGLIAPFEVPVPPTLKAALFELDLV